MPKTEPFDNYSDDYDDVAFLSWAKPTTGTPKHINDAVIEAINKGFDRMEKYYRKNK